MNRIERVGVYCASSSQCDPEYFEAANRLGRALARNHIMLYYGGGAVGLMGSLADGALSEGGEVIGVIPGFMNDLEWGHPGISELRVVAHLHERKRVIIEESDAIVALPGGCGTLEELFEAITWKRLGLHNKPIVIANVKGFFDPCLELLERCVRENFMHQKHRELWHAVSKVEEIIPVIQNIPPWSEDALHIAVL